MKSMPHFFRKKRHPVEPERRFALTCIKLNKLNKIG